jgi:glycosyltransferase involved in cell wall biosynthesis
LIEEYSKKPNVRLLENKYNEGHTVSRNRAILAAKGDYIAIHDADDISLPGRFQEEVDYLDKHSDIDFMGGHAIKISVTGETIGSMVYPPKNTQSAFSLITKHKLNPIIDPSCMYRREVILSNGGYTMNPDLKTVSDFELWCRLLVNGHKMTNLQKPLIKYRINPEGVTRTENKDMVYATNLVWSSFRRRVFKNVVIKPDIFMQDSFTEWDNENKTMGNSSTKL